MSLETTNTTSRLPKDLPLADYFQQMFIHTMDDEKKEYYKKPVEAKMAEVVGSWFSIFIAMEIALFIVMDIDVYKCHIQGGRMNITSWLTRINK